MTATTAAATKPAFLTAAAAPIGSFWSNRAADGVHFKNIGNSKGQNVSATKAMSWMLKCLVKGYPRPPQCGYKAFGSQWYAPCDMGAEVRQWREAGSGGQRVYWIGHASQLLCLHNGLNILLDPIFSTRASPLRFAGPKRRYPPATTVEQLPPIHVVTVSHNHYDHMDKASLKAVARQFPDAQFVVPRCLGRFLVEWGIPSTAISELDWWEEWASDGQAVRIACTPAQHWGKHSLCDNNEVLWCGWCIGWEKENASVQPVAEKHEGLDKSSPFSATSQPDRCGKNWKALQKYYFTGDTAYNPDVFEAIYSHYGSIDMAALPIGAYSPRWFMSPQHIDPEHAVQIFQDLHVQQALGIHWGTFELSEESLDEPPEVLRAALNASSINPDRFQTIPMGRHIAF